MSSDTYQIVDYVSEHQTDIGRILERIGWAQQYIDAAVQNAETFSKQPGIFGTYVALMSQEMVGFIYVQFYEWNRLAQIQGLAVDPHYHRRGIARALVDRAEEFAYGKQARGIYVDTPTDNLRGRGFYEASGYQFGYLMPRYYEDRLDGVTYQKFFDR
jgi:ribosomal protein S18 acetylase RimI-like enzyme